MPDLQIRTQPPSLKDPAYHAAFENTRAGVLRRRVIVCLGVLSFLLALSGLGSVFEYQEAVENEKTPWLVFIFGLLYDLSLTSMAVAMLLYVLTRRPDRRRLVIVIAIWAVSNVCVATYFESRRALMSPTDWTGRTLADADPGEIACQWGLVAFGVLTSLPLVLVPMRVRESRWIIVGGVSAYALVIFVLTGVTLSMALKYTLLAMLWSVAAMLYSSWRFSLFDADFERRELRDRYGTLSNELSNARALHESLFPPQRTSGTTTVQYVYEPMREIGGDFLFMPTHPRRDDAPASTCLVLIDVTGHGVASALAVNRLHGELVRMFAEADDAHPLSAGDVIANLNRYIYLTLSPQGVFATALCLLIEHDRGTPGVSRLRWASAGHPPALLIGTPSAHATPRKAIHHLGATAMMLGVLDSSHFESGEQEVSLAPGDSIIAYTDGLIETRDPQHQDLGIDGLEQLVLACRAAPSTTTSLAHGLFRAAVERRGNAPVMDDTLIVEVGIRACETRHQPAAEPDPPRDIGTAVP